MTEHPDVTRLRLAGFTVYPSLDADGFDTGLLFARKLSTHLEVVSAWRDDYALAARLPYARNWLKPFKSTVDKGSEVVSFTDAVDQLLNVRSQDGYGTLERAEGKPWFPDGAR